MITYCIILASIQFLGIVIQPDNGRRLGWAVELLLMMVVFGRIFGWW